MTNNDSQSFDTTENPATRILYSTFESRSLSPLISCHITFFNAVNKMVTCRDHIYI